MGFMGLMRLKGPPHDFHNIGCQGNFQMGHDLEVTAWRITYEYLLNCTHTYLGPANNTENVLHHDHPIRPLYGAF